MLVVSQDYPTSQKYDYTNILSIPMSLSFLQSIKNPILKPRYPTELINLSIDHTPARGLCVVIYRSYLKMYLFYHTLRI